MIEATKVVKDEKSAVCAVVTNLTLFKVNYIEILHNLPKLHEFKHS